MITLMHLPGLESEYTGGCCCFYLQSTVLGGAVKTPSSGISKVSLAKPQPGTASWPVWATPLMGGLTEAGALGSYGVRVGL